MKRDLSGHGGSVVVESLWNLVLELEPSKPPCLITWVVEFDRCTDNTQLRRLKIEIGPAEKV